LMKEAGLTPMQILQCATANAAKLFGGETGARLGNLENGYLADLSVGRHRALFLYRDCDQNGVAYPADSILH
jgi:imidazolonepropionase-like amidohydrolase